MAELPTGSVTFLFTDIEGSTQLLQRLGDTYTSALDAHNRIIRSAITQAGGVEVNTAGDSFFTVFPDAIRALNAAIMAQRNLAKHDWPPNAAIHVRMGLHSGTATVRDGSYVGLDINRASRITSAGYGGQVLISKSVYVQVSQQLPDGVSLLDLGQHTFKGLAEPEHIYQVVIPELASEFPPIRSVDSLAQSLPVASTNFVGRRQELDELSRLLADPQIRLVTILGPGGVGKSRLSVEAARRHAELFADGVVFVPLADVLSANTGETIGPVLTATARALALVYHAGASPLDQMLAHIRPLQLLIILDNFEHLLDSATIVSAILGNAPKVKVLVTSRERLNLPEEWLFPIKGLGYPEADGGVEIADNFAAIELFAQRARQALPDFDLTAELPCVSRVSQLVEGMPLGIELAAAWLRSMPCQDIVREIQGDVDFLSTNMRTVPSRHRSMRAVFDYSWQALSASEQSVLAKLSVFRSGFERKAAAAVADATPWSLTALVDKSMLQSKPDGRFGMHELLRQLAEEKLLETPGTYEDVRRQHAAYYCSFLWSQIPVLKGSGERSAFDQIAADMENVRMAWRWVAEYCLLEQLEQAMEPLSLFHEMQGRYLEALDVFELAVGSLRRLYEAEGASPERDLALAQALTFQAWFSTRLGRYQRATESFSESLSLLRKSSADVRYEVACNRFYYSVALFLQGKYQSAEPVIREALDGFEELDDPWGSALAFVLLGQTLHLVGRYAEAEEYSQASLLYAKQIGNRHTATYAISTLARIAMARGDYAQAEAFDQECLAIRYELGDKGAIAFTLRDLGYLSLLEGNVERAQDYYQQCLTLAEQIGSAFSKLQSLWGLGKIAHALGRYGEAKEYFRQTITMADGGGVVLHLIDGCLADPGWTDLALEDDEEAARFFARTVHIALEHQALPVLLDAVAGLVVMQTRQAPEAKERSVEYLSGVLHDPACHHETKDRVAGLYDSLVKSLPPEIAASAQTRGTEVDIQSAARVWADEILTNPD